MDAKQVLKEARHLIDHYGWIKGEYVSDDGFCLLGAVYHYGLPGTPDAIDTLESTVRYLYNLHEVNLARFNDRKAKSKEEILGVLDEAISTL